MAICMSMAPCHEHSEECDAKAAEAYGGRENTTLIAVRVPDATARRLRQAMANSRTGYASVGEYINYMLDLRVVQKR